MCFLHSEHCFLVPSPWVTICNVKPRLYWNSFWHFSHLKGFFWKAIKHCIILWLRCICAVSDIHWFDYLHLATKFSHLNLYIIADHYTTVNPNKRVKPFVLTCPFKRTYRTPVIFPVIFVATKLSVRDEHCLTSMIFPTTERRRPYVHLTSHWNFLLL